MPRGSTGLATTCALDAAASSAVMKWVEGWAPPRIAVLGGACHVLPPMKREDGAECAAEFVAPPEAWPEALPEADPPDPPCATGAPPPRLPPLAWPPPPPNPPPWLPPKPPPPPAWPPPPPPPCWAKAG